MNKKLILNTKNSHSLSAESEHLYIHVLGDLDYDNMESLAVTLKIKKLNSQAPPIRQSIDLYREERISNLIQKLCERFELGYAETEQTMYAFIELIETYRFKQNEIKGVFPKEDTLAKKELISAKNYLTQDHFIEALQSDLKTAGICSHINEALLLYIAMATRKQMKPLSFAFIDDSDISTLLFDVLKQSIPPSDYFFPSSISSQALYYFTSEELQHKVLLLSDVHTKQDILPILSELITKQSLSKIVALKDKSGLPFIMSPQIEASICFLGITKSRYKHKLKSLHIPKLPIQTTETDQEKWIIYNKRKSAGLVNTKEEQDARERLIHLQSILQTIEIINPYALDVYLPNHHKGNIELSNLFLEVIKAITFLHQFKREKHNKDVFGNTTKPYIQTEVDDIKLALELLKPVLEKEEDMLPMASRGFFEKLKTWSKKNEHSEFYTHQYRKDYPNIAPRTLNNYCKTLTDAGYLKIQGGNRHKGGYLYKIVEQTQETPKPNSYTDYTNTLLQTLEESH